MTCGGLSRLRERRFHRHVFVESVGVSGKERRGELGSLLQVICNVLRDFVEAAAEEAALGR
jgi:hypothetical protein